MNALTQRNRLGLEIAGMGLVGGLAGDTLLRAMPWGLNATICTAVLVGGGALLIRRNGVKAGPDTPWLAITVLLLGAAFLRRDAQTLATFDMLALIVTLALAAASVQGEWIAKWDPLDYIRGIVTSAVASVVGGLVLVFHDIKWSELPQDGRFRHTRGVLLGTVIAAPLLIIFAALFASADQVFGNVLTNLFAFDVQSVVTHTFLFVFWGALVAGYLRWSLLGRPVQLPGISVQPLPSVVPIATALGLLNFLFLLFVVVQLRYFFGGLGVVAATSGLTFATYARQGFFQLVAASGLVLPILLGADHLMRGGTAPQVRVFRQLAGLLLVLLAVIMASALQRMRLYVAEFGLSADRLYATAFMVLLIGVFAWFAWTILRGLRQRFAFGALMLSFTVLAGLHVLNPDAFIVNTNLRRPVAERPFDAKYAASLSADAVPALIADLPRLDPPARCVVAMELQKRWGNQPDPDWRTWNWSRARARRLVRSQLGMLREVSRTSCLQAVKEVPSNDH